MRVVQFSFNVLLIVPWISFISGLQCPSCTYLTTDANIPDVVRSIVDTILGVFQDKECTQDLKGPIPQIQEETCEDIKGEVPRCSFYKGSATLTIPLPLIPNIEIPMKIYQRGCYHFKSANVPSTGCHGIDTINEDKTVIQQLLDKVSSTLEKYEVANFQGEMCLCTDTYCKETSGVSQSVSISLVLLTVSLQLNLF